MAKFRWGPWYGERGNANLYRGLQEGVNDKTTLYKAEFRTAFNSCESDSIVCIIKVYTER